MMAMIVYVLSNDKRILGVYESLTTIEEEWDIELKEVDFGTYEATSTNGTTFKVERFALANE